MNKWKPPTTPEKAIEISIVLWEAIERRELYLRSSKHLVADNLGMGEFLNACPLCEFTNPMSTCSPQSERVPDCNNCPIFPAGTYGTFGCERITQSPYVIWHKDPSPENAGAFADFLRAKLRARPYAGKLPNPAMGRLLNRGFSPEAARYKLLELQEAILAKRGEADDLLAEANFSPAWVWDALKYGKDE